MNWLMVFEQLTWQLEFRGDVHSVGVPNHADALARTPVRGQRCSAQALHISLTGA